MALVAARECILRANLKATDIDAIVDFSVLPEDYVVPSWCMSNKIQSEVGAKNAFNLGFGGGGVTNLLVALRFVSSLIKMDHGVKTALLIASDVSVPGNRIINQENPMTILGDGASAMIVTEGEGVCEILHTELVSKGHSHDVFLLPGGGIAQPDNIEQYRLKIDHKKYSPDYAFNTLKELGHNAAQAAGVNLNDVGNFIGPNISAKDQLQFEDTFGISKKDPFSRNRRQYGHVQATDLIVNLSQIIENRGMRVKEHGLVCSHGWGFLSGAMLVRC